MHSWLRGAHEASPSSTPAPGSPHVHTEATQAYLTMKSLRENVLPLWYFLIVKLLKYKNNFLLGVIANDKTFSVLQFRTRYRFCFHYVFKRQELIIIHNEFLKLMFFYSEERLCFQINVSAELWMLRHHPAYGGSDFHIFLS